jgi:hypothetical protein
MLKGLYKNKKYGFSLIEILFSSLIIVISVIPLYNFYNRTIQSNRVIYLKDKANNYSYNIINKTKSKKFHEIRTITDEILDEDLKYNLKVEIVDIKKKEITLEIYFRNETYMPYVTFFKILK